MYTLKDSLNETPLILKDTHKFEGQRPFLGHFLTYPGKIIIFKSPGYGSGLLPRSKPSLLCLALLSPIDLNQIAPRPRGYH